MRILHVIQELGTGGAERVLLSAASAAAGAGADVAAVASPGPLAAELDGRVYPLPLVERKPWRLVPAALAVRTAVRDFRPDVIHAHNPAVGLAAAAVTRRGAAIPSFVTVQGVPDEDYARTARILRLGGLPVVACGPGVAAALAEHGLAVRATIPNGISAPPPAADRTALEAQWGVPPSHRLAVAVGRLAHQKNHLLAVRALADLPGVTLAVVGEGPLRADLERGAAAAGVAHRLVLAGARPDARAIMGAADVVVLPSRWEGLPLAGLEALAGGTPLVATAVRGVREVLHDGEDGLLVPPDDPPALAAAVRRVLEDPALARRLVQGGKALAARYGEDAMAASYLTLYRELAR